MHRNSCMWASGEHSDTGSLAFDSLSPVFLQAATFRRFDDVFGWFFNWINWRSGIFLLLVYLTYWPSKCAICCVLYDANFHEVWSWYDRPLPSPSICAAMSRDLMTSTFYLGEWSHIPVMWSTSLPNLKIIWLSIHELWAMTTPIGYHWGFICSHWSRNVKQDCATTWQSIKSWIRAARNKRDVTSNAGLMIKLLLVKSFLNAGLPEMHSQISDS